MDFLSIYIVSDSLGETGEQAAKAAISQFDMDNYEVKKFPYVLEKQALTKILEQAAAEEKVVLFYTLVDRDLVAYIEAFVAESGFSAVDLLSPMVDGIKRVLGMEPNWEPGMLRKLDDTYFRRVEAIEFAVKYDDGKDPRGLLKADLVLLGISRTSKTPLSMYLANKNIMVANVPLVPESIPPKEIYEVSPKRVVGLTNSPIKLNEIREERLKALGLPSGSNYAMMERILDEIDYAEKIMKKIGCPIIDVSNKAIEETAELIINVLKKNGVKVMKD
ncbi:MAG: pyruvate, water dikinase regulatory protein [Peptostreptococcaceae bacterium]|nr:pyruvate, water dikinase regulatory protein [Peptostreptococcaceae bacterium]